MTMKSQVRACFKYPGRALFGFRLSRMYGMTRMAPGAERWSLLTRRWRGLQVYIIRRYTDTTLSFILSILSIYYMLPKSVFTGDATTM